MNSLPSLTHRVLALWANNVDELDHDDLLWSVVDDDIEFAVDCSDVLMWGTADCVEITNDNVFALEAAIHDVKTLDPEKSTWAPMLFCARIRGTRPLCAWYRTLPEVLWPLFDQSGPPRDLADMRGEL